MGDWKTLDLRRSLVIMKMFAVLIFEFTSLIALVPIYGPERLLWAVLVSAVVGVMAILLIFDRMASYTVLAGLMMISCLLVSSLVRDFEALALWGILSADLFSVILGVATSGQSRILRGSAGMDRMQERVFMKEMLRSVGISLIVIIAIMIISLATLSLTFLAEVGLSSAAVMAALTILAIISLGTLVAMRHRF